MLLRWKAARPQVDFSRPDNAIAQIASIDEGVRQSKACSLCPREPQMIERRKFPRVETNKVALLRFEGGTQFESCRVLNLSAGGALLGTSHAQMLPERLSLYLDAPNRRLQVEVAECSVVRRNGEQVAVQFSDTRFIDGLSLGLQ
jgi:hypothetical protein